ncbi:uncharacterized protein LOC131842181 [Achroia grisella]|uniref:uncharacterized protein LOC131842181 n=1 Tax=Achroia grisella TaxID=688607 RepID=UPI0027D233A6|nr:uncharacterized protein LOC131842181 [Achroia grisella]
MECIVSDEPNVQHTPVDKNAKENDSAENFQKFIYELFEKNGVLNDLRAYLRGHIVDVLKSAQTGDPPPCQRHFTQRLDLTYQALNILIAEYLLCLEFSYSLSVFVSEIPLANMVFSYAKALLQSHNEASPTLRFEDGDVWSILNYLGIRCDSEHACKVVQLYKSKENPPLLLCILKCIPMYNKDAITVEQDISSMESLSSVKSSDTIAEKMNSKSASCHEKCKHYVFCKICQNKINGVKDEYMKKRKKIAKTVKDTHMNPINMEILMKNISAMEKSLIDEMFQQLKSVYEAEVEMVKVEEDQRTKRTLATHVAELQRHHDEMEASFKAREAKLEKNVEQKKRFLWGLARQLRDQHAQLSRAMLAMHGEAERLTRKEESLKCQLLEAETVLKKRGEEMRIQISNELVILEGHLESMKQERDNINQERLELQSHKTDTTSMKDSIMNEDLKAHYDLLKNELSILKKYLETTKMEPKCVIERGTLTDLNDVTSKINIMLNNEETDRNLRNDTEERARAPNQVVNDLKKQKNVNFSQSNLDEVYRQRSRERSRSSASSEAGDAADRGCDCDRHGDRQMPCCHMQHDILQHLRDENESLKNFARQQRTHIDDLTSQQARLQAELTSARSRADAGRPRTAPAMMPHCNYFSERLNMSASANTFGWRKGAGEELSVFSEARPRVLVPGDVLPFVGALRDYRDGRRHLINQWRALRRSSAVAVRRTTTHVTLDDHATSPATPIFDRPASAGAKPGMISAHCGEEPDIAGRSQNITFRDHVPTKSTEDVAGKKAKEKSPKSMLKEAKENLKNKDSKRNPPAKSRVKSPNAVLREAKLRLRKLEIEAEAVEKSYLDFKKRQTEFKEDRKSYTAFMENPLIRNISSFDTKESKTFQKVDGNNTSKMDIHKNYKPTAQFMKTDFEKYLCEYKAKFDIREIHSKNKSGGIEELCHEPAVLKKDDEVKRNYLETPLIEFRKFYHSQHLSRPLTIIDDPCPTLSENIEHDVNNENSILDVNVNNKNNEQVIFKSRNEFIRKAKPTEEDELNILKENLNKIYNLPEQTDVKPLDIEKDNIETAPKCNDVIMENSENLLRLEVENVCETSKLNLSPSQPQEMLLVVQSSVEAREDSQSDEKEKISTQMTIIISPKKADLSGLNDTNMDRLISPDIPRIPSPEEAAHLTRNEVLDAIFHADANNHISSTDMKQELPKEVLEDSISEYEKGGDYVDDFSADVDNYNSRSEYENNSPISLPKTSEDENFWDS